MQAFAYHWIYLDFWVPVWPNLAASLLVWSLMWLKMHSIQKVHEEAREMHARLLKEVGRIARPEGDRR